MTEHWIQRARGVERRALHRDARVRPARDLGLSQPFAEHLHQTRLADPGFTRQEHGLALARNNALEPLDEQRHFLLAADEGRELALARLEPTFGRTLGEYPRGGNRLAKTFQQLRAELVEHEPGADELPREAVDHDLIRPRKRLQPRGQVWRVAGHCAGLPPPSSIQVPDDDHARGDADARTQALAILEL